MGVGRIAPHRVRARYAQALRSIPLPVRSFGAVDPGGLTTIGEAEIDDRLVRFGVLFAIPRLWITFPEQVPTLLGFVTGFDGAAKPELHLTEPDHLAWARKPRRTHALKREAAAAWEAAQRDCEG